MGIASALVVLIQVVLAEAGATTQKKNDEVMENLIVKRIVWWTLDIIY